MENAISWHSMPMFTPILLVSPPRPSPLAPPLTLRYYTLFAMIEQYYREKVPTEHLLRLRFFFFFFDVLQSGHGDVVFVAESLSRS